MEGEVVASEMKAETLAEYFDKVQWCVRPVTHENDVAADMNEELPIDVGAIRMTELRYAAQKLKSNRASGIDDVPAEFWKIMLVDDEHAASLWILEFMNMLWFRKLVPEHWLQSRVTALFKKCDLGNYSNYRPVSLVCVGYKLFVTIFLDWLNNGGVESRI